LKSTLYGRHFKDLEVGAIEIQAAFANPRQTWWLDLQNPAEQDLRILCAALHVHPLTIEDILNRETREKIEDYGTYYYACIWSYRGLDDKLRTTYKPYSTYMIVFPTGTLTITFTFRESDHPAKVLKRIDLLKDYVSINSDWVFYAFMYVALPCYLSSAENYTQAECPESYSRPSV
jgi:magnesium transporter